jgi:DNA-binding transcriptional LysR family regulator
MNWDDLRVFLALARHRKLGAAASSLGMDPTTMSRRITRLAMSLNATLFEQNNGQHVLTERGAGLMLYAERAEAAMLEATDTESGGGMAGLIRVGVPESLGASFLAPRLLEFEKAHPQIVIDLISPSWLFDPLKREIDVALMPARPLHGPLTARRLINTTLRLYGTQAYLDSHPPILTREDIRDHRFIGYVRQILPASEAGYSDAVLPNLPMNMRTTSINIQQSLIATGSGIGLLPYYLGTAHDELVPILEDEVQVPHSFWLVVREDVRYSARIIAFVDWISRAVRESGDFFRPSPEAAS